MLLYQITNSGHWNYNSHFILLGNFNHALEIMNRSVSAPGLVAYQPGARENIAYLCQTEKLRDTDSDVYNSKKNEYEVNLIF